MLFFCVYNALDAFLQVFMVLFIDARDCLGVEELCANSGMCEEKMRTMAVISVNDRQHQYVRQQDVRTHAWKP